MLVKGNMAIARLMEMRGKPMRGWLRVDPAGVRTERELETWVRLGGNDARFLSTKRSRG